MCTHHHLRTFYTILDKYRDNIPENNGSARNTFIAKHPIIANIVIIAVVATLALCVAYLSIAIFTKHGQTDVVPKVENMSYSRAVELLHEAGFNVDIRDSVYKEDVKPGYVIEQFPKANSVVKPGRKIFLYINAVHPKEVVIDDTRNPADYAMRGISFRQGMARLQELGFKNIRVVRVLGDNDRIVKILANGRIVRNMEHIPVNAQLVVEISDGRLSAMRDSLYDLERLREAGYGGGASYNPANEYPAYEGSTESGNSTEESSPSRNNSGGEEENLEYF